RDTRLEKAQTVNGATVGMDKDKNVIVQRKVFLAESLRNLEKEVYSMENDLYGNEKYGTRGTQGVLKDCEKKLADPRIGGTGKLKPIATSDRVTEEEDDVKFVIDEKGDLVGITEEKLRDRIDRFRGYKKILGTRKAELGTDIEICEQKHREALIANGLAPEDGDGKGEWVTGPQGFKVWRAKKRETSNPEVLSKRKFKRETDESNEEESEQ
ncbi:MAG: hypothetical protein ABIR96_03665, partial [Bdellovibrionota bacterium]